MEQEPPRAPSLVVQLGYVQAVSGVAVSADGSLGVAGSFSGTTRLWDLATGLELRRFDGHTAGVVAIAFSPDGRRVATGSHDTTARLWDAATGVELHRFEGESGAMPSSVSFSGDGRALVVGFLGGGTRLYDADTGELRLEVGSDPPGSPIAALSPDGARIATAGVTPGIRVWDATDGSLLMELGLDAPPLVLPGGLRFGGDGATLWAGHADGSARGWDVVSGEAVATLSGHAGGVSGLGLSDDGETLLTTSQTDGRAIVWDVADAAERASFGGGVDFLWAGALAPSGGAVFAGSVLSASLFDVATTSLQGRFEGYSNRVSGVGFSPGGERLRVGDLGFGVHLWDVEAGRRDVRLEGMFSAFAADVELLVATDPGGTRADVWDTTADTLLRSFNIDEGPLMALAVSPGGELVATRGASDPGVTVWSVETGERLADLPTPDDEIVQALAFLPDGRGLAAAGVGVRVWDVGTGQSLAHFEGVVALDVASTPDGSAIVAGGGELVTVLELVSGSVRTLGRHDAFVTAVDVSPNGEVAASVGDDRTLRLWDLESGEPLVVASGHGGRVVDVAFAPDGVHLLTGSEDGTARLWDAVSGTELVSLVALTDGSWVAVSPEGRFDTSDVERLRGVHWVMPDAPFEALPIEIFMRDYFEPRLVGRLLEGEELPPVPNLAELNRIQPGVELVGAEVHADGTVSVDVRVREGAGLRVVDGDSAIVTSGVHDLRLFRDGQLVAWRDGPQGLGVDGASTVRFEGVRLPGRPGSGLVELSAYAFNEDRVKSTTARRSVERPGHASGERGRAYVVTVGVDAYESPVWDLRFAANDARLLSRDLEARLRGSGAFREVVAIPLVSAHDPAASTVASKAAVRGALDLLAGREVESAVRALIPGGDRLDAAGPDDLVFLSFSAHGYRDADGAFYLFPSDIGADAEKRVTPELLRRAINSDELTAWMRGIDAGEIVLVVDACHSAAAVEGAGFKPGPMGSRGLGQLAYDKGMRVLAASQAEDVALESDLIRQGLLTYALVRDGLEAGQADRPPVDGAITLSEWLRYGVERVPTLYVEVQEGEVQTFDVTGRSVEIGGGGDDPDFQQPALFDFRGEGLALSLGGADPGR